MWYFPIQSRLPGNCLSFFINRTKSFGAVANNQNLATANPARSSFLFSRNQTKMGDYPGSGYKMSSYGLKVYNPQETVGQWTQCCKVYYTCIKEQITTCSFGLRPVSLTKLNFMPCLFTFQREDAIRKNHIVTTGGEGVADTWKVERPKSLDLHQDTSYFRAKTLVC